MDLTIILLGMSLAGVMLRLPLERLMNPELDDWVFGFTTLLYAFWVFAVSIAATAVALSFPSVLGSISFALFLASAVATHVFVVSQRRDMKEGDYNKSG